MKKEPFNDIIPDEDEVDFFFAEEIVRLYSDRTNKVLAEQVPFVVKVDWSAVDQTARKKLELGDDHHKPVYGVVRMLLHPLKENKKNLPVRLRVELVHNKKRFVTIVDAFNATVVKT